MSRTLRALSPVLLIVATAAAALAEEGGAAPKKSLSLFDLYIATMPIGAVLTILSFITLSLSIMWLLNMKRSTLVPPHLADDVHNSLAEGVTDESIENARNIVSSDPSMLGNVLTAALDKKDLGYEAMKEAAESVGASEHNKYMAKVGWLSMFASSATLIGLIGTVSGIIGSFLKLSAAPGGVDPNILAENIGEALVCTFLGLSIAVVGLYFFFALRNRVNQAALDTGVIANEILDYFRAR